MPRIKSTLRATRAGSPAFPSMPTPGHCESQLTLLLELVQVMNTVTDVASVLDKALALIAEHLHMMRGAITLVSPRTGEIRIESSYGLKPAERRRGHYVRGEGITGRVIESGRPMYITHVSREPLFLNRTRSRDLSKEDISFICVPIRLNGQVVGALSVDRLLADTATLEDDVRLLLIIASLLGHTALETQGRMSEEGRPSLRPKGFVGSSEIMQKVYAQIAQVASSATTVFLQGESGTGKELAARAIHASGPRAARPFISLNCAALPENLIESELFGHERGAFTGANAMRKGRFELADGGTLFLDEVGELSLMTQAKLLRVLQERSFERLGGMETKHVDVRIITATNRNLEEMVEQGGFRRDLFYRLNVFPIFLPPLRRRPEDILPLADHFIRRYAQAGDRKNARLSLAVMDMLQRYAWPGNIRELENVMERAVLLVGREGLILPQHLPPGLHSVQCAGRQGGSACCALPGISGGLQERLDELERACIVEALEWSRGRMGKAAARLGLTERIMALRLKKYGLDYKDFRAAAVAGQGRMADQDAPENANPPQNIGQ
ncbi:sigma 54-interacting transcriptional regulator [Desulfovibrio sp. ZJ369]|uniref:sigma-54 interaction domain-containing protein n=1 Tax=Desulfovibrio sp. ZJ369 TaxID=2709793 RepID=UPI00197D05E0|nr:sigma 54-interacting transcriptional regulator [Desulfovibrio sp. ZJ369]